MTDNIPITKIRKRILDNRGLTSIQPSARKHKRLKPSHLTSLDHLKTPKMRYLELKYKAPIEQMLLSGSLSVVVKNLGNEIDTSTASKWIKKLNLRYSADNLPNCEGCLHYRPSCDYGICVLLIELELWELVELKKQTMTGELMELEKQKLITEKVVQEIMEEQE